MSAAALMAGAAGALGVAAAWEALTAVDRLALDRAGRWLRGLGAMGHSSSEQRRLTLVALVSCAAGGWLVAGPPAAAALALGAPLAVRQVLARRRRAHRHALRRGLPALARAVADALAGGHSIRGALSEAAGSGGVPGAAGAQLRRMADDLAVGASTEAVLDGLRTRAACPEADAVVAAIGLQRDAGGDLAGLLRDLAGRLEEGCRLEDDARAATAQARFTAWLVGGLPAAGAALAEMAAPGHLASLAADPLTGSMLAVALVLQVAALAAVRRIARVTR